MHSNFQTHSSQSASPSKECNHLDVCVCARELMRERRDPFGMYMKKIFISANLFHIYCVVSLFLHVRRSHYTEKEESTIAIQHKLWHPYAKWTEATEGWILWSENKWTDSFPSFQEETQTSFRGQCSMKHYANAFQVRHRSLPKRELPIRHGWWFLALEEP